MKSRLLIPFTLILTLGSVAITGCDDDDDDKEGVRIEGEITEQELTDTDGGL